MSNLNIQEIVTNLRGTLASKVPGLLTDPAATKRITRTVDHYIGQIQQRSPPGAPINSQEVLRLSYDSMISWLKGRGPLTGQQGTSRFESEVDPETAFASIMASREQQVSSSPRNPPGAPSSADTLMPVDLLSRRPPTEFRGRAPESVQQKDVIQPQEDIVKYREVEYNLILNSKDRDWLNNTKENRYSFTVQFRARTMGPTMGPQPTVVNRLQNIKRIEFIKAVIPNEGLCVTVPLDASGNPTPTTAFTSVLSLPSVTVMVDEIQGNNTGTNQDMDKALAVCQYDATWRSEANFTTYGVNRGYTLFIPKFMKAQREYTPAPLANLQTLTIRLVDTESNLLSTLPDSSSISRIVFGDVSITTSIYDSTSYIFIQTSTYFPYWSYSQLDKLLFQGITLTPPPTVSGASDFITWLQDTAGHMIVGVGYSSGGSPYAVTDGANSAGYANWIIIRNRFEDPSTGSTDPKDFSSNEATFRTDVAAATPTGALLNLNRQVQLSLRAIVREMDNSSMVRSDNV
jgi:hypothetical protein